MSKKPTTPGPRDERGVLAARILDAAREAFAETGWAGTTIRAVARVAGVDPALVYHYFDSKEGLLDAATNPPARWLENVATTWAAPISRSWAASHGWSRVCCCTAGSMNHAAWSAKIRRVVSSARNSSPA